MRERDAGWIRHRSEVDPALLIQHPAVVLRVAAPRRWVVIHGTSTERNERREIVENGSADDVFDLTGPTFFYRRGILIVTDPVRFSRRGECPPDLFLALRELAGVSR